MNGDFGSIHMAHDEVVATGLFHRVDVVKEYVWNPAERNVALCRGSQEGPGVDGILGLAHENEFISVPQATQFRLNLRVAPDHVPNAMHEEVAATCTVLVDDRLRK